MTIFGSLDMSENQIANHLRAIESQSRAASERANVGNGGNEKELGREEKGRASKDDFTN